MGSKYCAAWVTYLKLNNGLQIIRSCQTRLHLFIFVDRQSCVVAINFLLLPETWKHFFQPRRNRKINLEKKKGTLRFNRDLALQERLCVLAIVINNMPKLAHKGSKIRLCKYIHDRTPKDYHELTIWSSCIHLVLHHRWPSLSPCKGFMHESS